MTYLFLEDVKGVERESNALHAPNCWKGNQLSYLDINTAAQGKIWWGMLEERRMYSSSLDFCVWCRCFNFLWRIQQRPLSDNRYWTRQVSTSIFNHRPKSLRGVKEVLMVPQGLKYLYLEREKQYKEKVQNGIYLGTQDKPSEVTDPPPLSKPAICKYWCISHTATATHFPVLWWHMTKALWILTILPE